MSCSTLVWKSLSHADPLISKDILRGALTNGREWIFLIVSRKNGDGATYKESFVHTYDVLHTAKHSPPDIVKPKPDLIAGILSYWVSRFLFRKS